MDDLRDTKTWVSIPLQEYEGLLDRDIWAKCLEEAIYACDDDVAFEYAEELYDKIKGE